MKNPRNIVITGASSGLGASLAQYYAAPGIRLNLQGRNAERLEKTAEICRKRGADVHTGIGNVADRAFMDAWLSGIDAASPVELVVANAGVSAGTGIHGETGEQVREIFSTNIDGVVNTLQPLIFPMIARGRGQLAIMSSLAGMRGLPSCPAYSASKACVKAYGEGLRGWLGAKGVEVSVICPGYIKTPMTAVNNFPMPFLMSAEKASRIIAQGLERNKSRIAFPLGLYLPTLVSNLLPLWIIDPILARLPAKDAAL